ncbi:ricin-type beta-trefoil lectin domain protein [Kutzneria sp. 744]|uniref:ricin-type beta-trefoil lectin domain protein n=1 Tax=Kutzneria sp. (strain 744) TaxID=345341 RepID=UPI0003EEAE10|nr:ricin-type beta-trefoil lectin domain protein [Kutzneria sp. 744]EWM12412.1 glucosylceramidase [Kutzneria sp. 744]
MRPTLLVVPLVLVAGMVAAPAANAANESVNIWLTSTNDSGGRNVTRGLQQQSPISFTAGTGTGQQTITVDENTRYQQFEGAGASFTDTTAYLMNSSGALSAATRNATMQKLFDPVNGIGLSFLRNPMGASDLARYSYTYDDGAADPNLTRFSLSHDLVDVIPLTKQAKQLNPQLKVMASPWTAPPWMKDNNSYIQGWLQSQYYQAYANYFVKYIQGFQAQGVPVDYVSEQNEPTVGGNYPGMNWNGSGLAVFAKNNLLPALHNAGLSTKVLALDWNWDSYDSFAAPTVNDASIRNDPNFGGVAWHGYEGDVSEQTTIHNQYPSMNMYETEHSGGNWIGNQQNEDMNNIIDYTRNWDRSVVKWSLAVDEHQGPNNGGCSTCTGLITVHQNDNRGQVDYNIEYYDMGQLTKFVKPGATRIASNDSAVRNVAWINPDGSKALVAYNPSGSAQSVRVNWGNESFTYSVPAATSATFTWNGTQGGTTTPPPGGRTITGIGGKCVDVAGANSANGTQVQIYTCNGTAAQTWTQSGSALQSLGKCLDVSGASTANGAKVQLYDCNGSGAQQWTQNGQHELVNTGSGKCLDATNQSSADGTPLQIWTCAGGANQQWTLN